MAGDLLPSRPDRPASRWAFPVLPSDGLGPARPAVGADAGSPVLGADPRAPALQAAFAGVGAPVRGAEGWSPGGLGSLGHWTPRSSEQRSPSDSSCPPRSGCGGRRWVGPGLQPSLEMDRSAAAALPIPERRAGWRRCGRGARPNFLGSDRAGPGRGRMTSPLSAVEKPYCRVRPGLEGFEGVPVWWDLE